MKVQYRFFNSSFIQRNYKGTNVAIQQVCGLDAIIIDGFIGRTRLFNNLFYI